MKKEKQIPDSESEKLQSQIEELKEKFSTLVATDFQFEEGMVNNENAVKKVLSKKNAKP